MSLVNNPSPEFVDYCISNLKNEYNNNSNLSLISILNIMGIKFNDMKRNDRSKSSKVREVPHLVKVKKPMTNTTSIGFSQFSDAISDDVDLEFPLKTHIEKKRIINYRWQKLDEDKRKYYSDLASKMSESKVSEEKYSNVDKSTDQESSDIDSSPVLSDHILELINSNIDFLNENLQEYKPYK